MLLFSVLTLRIAGIIFDAVDGRPTMTSFHDFNNILEAIYYSS
jgi:hypothetical protein